MVTFDSSAVRLRSSASRNACTLLSERPAEARPAERVLVLRALLARLEAARLGFALTFVAAFAVVRLRALPVDFEPPDLVAMYAS